MAIDYDRWAQTYDDTRAASPSVLDPVLQALGPAASRTLLDIGGGTGNYAVELARAGFRVALCDFTPAMVRRAAKKLPPACLLAVADAQRLPFRDASFDCAVSIKVLNHIPDWRSFLHEARRVLREGPLVLLNATKETMQAHWICAYVPSLVSEPRFHSRAAIRQALRSAGFQRVATRPMHYRDSDGSASALKHDPEAFLSAVTNTSLLSGLSGAGARRALDVIRRDHESGRLRDVIARYEPLVHQYGDGSLLAAYP